MGMWWFIGFGAAAAVVLIVAVLLVGILYQARRIRKLGAAAIVIVGEIDENTRAVWLLRKTNAVASDLRDGARLIDANADAVRSAIVGDDASAGKAA